MQCQDSVLYPPEIVIDLCFDPVVMLADSQVDIGPPDDTTLVCPDAQPLDVVSLDVRDVTADGAADVALHTWIQKGQ